MPRIKDSLKAIKQVSYDDQHLYIFDKGIDTQIDLERVKNVEITSLDGLYRFNLMDQEAFGPFILCKTSMWYPLNFRKVDKELDHVRYLISKRKRQTQNGQYNQLPSYTA